MSPTKAVHRQTSRYCTIRRGQNAFRDFPLIVLISWLQTISMIYRPTACSTTAYGSDLACVALTSTQSAKPCTDAGPGRCLRCTSVGTLDLEMGFLGLKSHGGGELGRAVRWRPFTG